MGCWGMLLREVRISSTFRTICMCVYYSVPALFAFQLCQISVLYRSITLAIEAQDTCSCCSKHCDNTMNYEILIFIVSLELDFKWKWLCDVFVLLFFWNVRLIYFMFTSPSNRWWRDRTERWTIWKRGDKGYPISSYSSCLSSNQLFCFYFRRDLRLG